DVEHHRPLVARKNIGLAQRLALGVRKLVPPECLGLLGDFARVLDADDIRPHVRKQPCAVRPWQELREVDDPDPFKCAHYPSHPAKPDAGTGLDSVRPGASITAEWKSGPGTDAVSPVSSSTTSTNRPRALRCSLSRTSC